MSRWRRRAAGAAVAAFLAMLAGAGFQMQALAQTPSKTPSQAQAKRPTATASTAAAAAPATPSGPPYAERFATVCAACHGANGRSEMEGVPVLAGQYSLYAITQLFLFREGRRDNAAMIALGKQMTDADLRGYSEYIGTLPPVAPPPPAETPDAGKMRLGSQLAKDYKCTFCHGNDLAGGQQVPRIGGQKEEYLRHTLHGFKDGSRPGYTRAMTEALSQVPAADLDVLAYYIRYAGP